MAKTTSVNSIDKIDIRQLPESCSRLMNGRIYLIINELFEYTQMVTSQINASHRQVILITHSDPRRYTTAVNINSSDNIDIRQQQFYRQVEQGNIRVFQFDHSHIDKISDDRVKAQKIIATHVEQFINELRYFIKAQNCVLLIENGLHMLGVEYNGLVNQVIDMWHEHISYSNNTLMFFIAGVQSNPLILNNIKMIQDKIAGFANIDEEDGQAKLTVHSWFSSTGICAERQFVLSTDQQGFLQADVIELQNENQVTAPAVDSESVWTLSSVVKGEDWPQAWAVSDKFADLDARSEGAVSGTIILPYGQKTEIEILARQVFMLRKTRGNRLKIIIREISARMRHSQERLIRYLGASMVAPLEVGFSRLLGMIDSIRDLEFESQLCDDFEQAFISANPQRKQGYLSPRDFVEHVRDLIEQTRSFGIKFAFVKLAVHKATKARDVLKVCQIRRPGDICSADDKHLYLFLFGCRESDIAKALEFIFHIPAAQLFESEERNTTIDETRLAIEAFELKVEAGKVKDHTEWLQKNRNQSAHGQGKQDAIFGYRQTVVEFNKQPAIAAVRKPLVIK